jgi:hypothetical protein
MYPHWRIPCIHFDGSGRAATRKPTTGAQPSRETRSWYAGMHRAFAAQEQKVPMPTLYATPLSANDRKVLAVSRQLELETEVRLVNVYRGEVAQPG